MVNNNSSPPTHVQTWCAWPSLSSPSHVRGWFLTAQNTEGKCDPRAAGATKQKWLPEDATVSQRTLAFQTKCPWPRMKRGYATRPLCDTAERHTDPTVGNQSDNNRSSERQQGANAEGQTATCWSNMLTVPTFPWGGYKNTVNMPHSWS